MKGFIRRLAGLAAFTAISAGSALSQDYLPALGDNYMGINQALLQPASIVDSRFKVDVNVMGFSSDMHNDMIRFTPGGIFNPFGITTEKPDLSESTYLDDPDWTDKSFFVSQNFLGPSFLISFGRKHAVGFTYRARNILNADGLDEPLARSMYEDFNASEYTNQWYRDDDMRAVNQIFVDYGFSYATEIFDLGAHYLKTGITVKLMQGLAGAAIQADEFYYYIYRQEGAERADNISVNSPFVSSGVSRNWNWGYQTSENHTIGFDYAFVAKPTAGLDLGLVYEFRPKYADFRYNMDGEEGLYRNDKNKYRVKVGVSILDIGRLRYKKAYNSQDFSAAYTPDYEQRYNTGNDNVPTSTHWMRTDIKLGFPPYVNLSDTLFYRGQKDQGIEAENQSDQFTIQLPTALSFQVDVNVVKGLYVNLTSFTALHQGFSETGRSHYISNYSLTPRYEHKWFSVMVPISYNQYEKFNAGLALRAAFLYAGVNNLFSGLISDPYSTSVYFGVKIPIWYGKPPADRDFDAVSDERDRCPDNPGVWAFLGCPDRDNDGVADTEDDCPDIPGPKEFRGCPDRDGDGVPDRDDRCPDQPGPKLTDGCPDRDGDGVTDIEDECPDNRGPASMNGCPDMDGDGVPDYKDKCPEIAGPVDQGGCPFLDTDGDGVKDSEDMCPEQPGPAENKGCPYSDTDGDGVIDRDDRCPLTPGDPANNGCPVIKEEEQKVLRTAFENLEFETGKAVIRSSSFNSLNELAALLISKPTWKLRISGHTDNVGSDASNMTLSKNRSQATAAYLQGKGVAKGQLIAEWFGETMPIADNNTPDGRQKNRRVEMQVVFD